MNREIVLPGGAGIYPLTGDVQSQAGSPRVTVIGLQTVPIDGGFPADGSILQYNPNFHNWQPILRASIQLNSVTISDDGWMSVNVPKETLVNGV